MEKFGYGLSKRRVGKRAARSLNPSGQAFDFRDRATIKDCPYIARLSTILGMTAR